MRLQALRERRRLAECPHGMILNLPQGDALARSLEAGAGDLAQDLPLQRSLCRHHVSDDPDAGIAADLQGSQRRGDIFPEFRES